MYLFCIFSRLSGVQLCSRRMAFTHTSSYQPPLSPSMTLQDLHDRCRWAEGQKISKCQFIDLSFLLLTHTSGSPCHFPQYGWRKKEGGDGTLHSSPGAADGCAKPEKNGEARPLLRCVEAIRLLHFHLTTGSYSHREYV